MTAPRVGQHVRVTDNDSGWKGAILRVLEVDERAVKLEGSNGRQTFPIYAPHRAVEVVEFDREAYQWKTVVDR